MKIIIKRVFNPTTNQETGAVITAAINEIPETHQKRTIEQFLIQYAFDKLYPNEGLNFYSNIENDTVSIVVVRDINSIAYEEIELEIPQRRISKFQEFVAGFKNRKI
jgi:hypothetical protein